MHVRRLLLALGAVVLVLLLAVSALLGSAFAGNAPLQPGPVEALGEIVQDGYVSVGLVDLRDGAWALVDAGNDPSGAAILAALAAHGADASSVRAILLTHAHGDHVAACGLFPRATTWLLPEELPYAKGEAHYVGLLPQLAPAAPAPCAELRVALDGQPIGLGPRTAVPFRVAGHTEGSAAWLVDDVLFAGDALRVRADGSMEGAPWFFSDHPEQELAALQELRDRLKALDVPLRRVFNSHTGPVSGAAFLAGPSGAPHG